MLKRWSLIGITLLACLLVVGCGVPQDEHDAMVAERDTALAKVASLESDLSATESELETTENILEETEDDLAATQSDLAATQSELADAESQISSLGSAANKAKSDLSAAQAEYSTYKSDVSSLWTSLDSLLSINYITLGINAELLLDNLDGIYQGCLLMTGELAALGDEELEALWEQAYVVEGGGWNLYYTPFESFMQALAERIDSEREALEARLSE